MPFYNITFRNEKNRIQTERTVEGKENETEAELAEHITDPIAKKPGWKVVEGSKREVEFVTKRGGR